MVEFPPIRLASLFFKVVKDKLFIQRRLASLRNTFRSLVKR